MSVQLVLGELLTTYSFGSPMFNCVPSSESTIMVYLYNLPLQSKSLASWNIVFGIFGVGSRKSGTQSPSASLRENFDVIL